MAGNNRIETGEIAQSAMKGKAMESALAGALNSPQISKKTKKAKKK